jgi:hypothetical protein
MKPRRLPIALKFSTSPCQRPLCLDLGRIRVQRRQHSFRMLYICDHCLEALLPIYLDDLFVKFGKPIELDRPKNGRQVRQVQVRHLKSR